MLLYTQIAHFTFGVYQSVHDIHTCLNGLDKLINIHNSPPLLCQPDLDRILLHGLNPSSWTSQRHFGLTKPYLGPLHAPSLCGVWHNGADHFVVFYICSEFWTIIDPLHSFTSPTYSMTNNTLSALATTYLHHNLPVPTLPPFRRVNRIAIQNDFLLVPWSCGTIAILTTIHITKGTYRNISACIAILLIFQLPHHDMYRCVHVRIMIYIDVPPPAT